MWVVIDLIKVWLWEMKMIEFWKFFRKFFNYLIVVILRWLVGLLRSRILGLYVSVCVNVVLCC